MFKNVGRKIKGLTRIMFAIGCIVSVVIAFFAVMTNSNAAGILVALLVIALGVFFSWLSVIMLYSYGQLVDDTDKIVVLLEQQDIVRKQEAQPTVTPQNDNK